MSFQQSSSAVFKAGNCDPKTALSRWFNGFPFKIQEITPSWRRCVAKKEFCECQVSLLQLALNRKHKLLWSTLGSQGSAPHQTAHTALP